MRAQWLSAVVVVSLVFPAATRGRIAPAAQQPKHLRAQVRQLDFLQQGWTQVLLTGTSSPTLMTRNANI